jgi:Fe-S-cluster containining protein
MNRHDRRRARKMDRENKFYEGYVRGLPRVPLDAPLERGRVYHLVVQHDSWCAFYDGQECNCDPIITKHEEPIRS